MRIRTPSRRALTILARVSILGLAALTATPSVLAFCGFYVANADGRLANKSSQIIIARDGNRMNITMTSDFQGNFKDFAMVVPVPSVLQKDQIRVVDANTVSKLNAYSVPRLVEYFDADPCVDNRPGFDPRNGPVLESGGRSVERTKALGVTVEAQYTVGEYDIVILSATQSDGLETWLRENNYKIPKGARATLEPYITGGMKFFVAKVNLENFSKTGFTLLRPLQMGFETPMFMLPLRLGMLNAVGDQDLVVYALTRKGRVETVNYPNVKVPSDAEVPLFVKKEFGKVYAALFQRAYERENKKVSFLEYAWNTSNCDPCSSDPPTMEELQRAGAGWVGQDPGVFLTRIHVRYNKKNFKEDLMFRETNSSETFQARYVLRHNWNGEAKCDLAKTYLAAQPKVLETQAQNLARLTGWKIEDIRRKAGIR
jgi:hypothetical protein